MKKLIILIFLIPNLSFSQKIFLIQLKSLKENRIDSLEISNNLHSHDKQVHNLALINSPTLILSNFKSDTIQIKPLNFIPLFFTGLKTITSDTIKIEMVDFNKYAIIDTIIYTIERKKMFGSKYKSNSRKEFKTPSTIFSEPPKEISLFVNGLKYPAFLHKMTDYETERSCNKRVSYGKLIIRHSAFYKCDLKK